MGLPDVHQAVREKGRKAPTVLYGIVYDERGGALLLSCRSIISVKLFEEEDVQYVISITRRYCDSTGAYNSRTFSRERVRDLFCTPTPSHSRDITVLWRALLMHSAVSFFSLTFAGGCKKTKTVGHTLLLPPKS